MVVQRAAHSDPNIIFGANLDDSIADEVWVTVIATRFEDGQRRLAPPSARERRQAEAGTSGARGRERRRDVRDDLGPRDVELDVPEYVPGG